MFDDFWPLVLNSEKTSGQSQFKLDNIINNALITFNNPILKVSELKNLRYSKGSFASEFNGLTHQSGENLVNF